MRHEAVLEADGIDLCTGPRHPCDITGASHIGKPANFRTAVGPRKVDDVRGYPRRIVEAEEVLGDVQILKTWRKSCSDYLCTGARRFERLLLALVARPQTDTAVAVQRRRNETRPLGRVIVIFVDGCQQALLDRDTERIAIAILLVERPDVWQGVDAVLAGAAADQLAVGASADTVGRVALLER